MWRVCVSGLFPACFPGLSCLVLGSHFGNGVEVGWKQDGRSPGTRAVSVLGCGWLSVSVVGCVCWPRTMGIPSALAGNGVATVWKRCGRSMRESSRVRVAGWLSACTLREMGGERDASVAGRSDATSSICMRRYGRLVGNGATGTSKPALASGSADVASIVWLSVPIQRLVCLVCPRSAHAGNGQDPWRRPQERLFGRCSDSRCLAGRDSRAIHGGRFRTGSPGIRPDRRFSGLDAVQDHIV